MIGETNNFQNDYLQIIAASILDILEGEICWTYKFTTGDKDVVVPFFYSLLGEDRFLLDSFSDDTVSNNRKSDLNIEKIPRGILTQQGFDIRSDEMANPNVFMTVQLEDKKEIKKVLARVKPIPITIHYELVIILNNVGDYFKCSTALLDTIGVFRYFQYNYNSMCIYAAMQLPDTNQFQKEYDQNMATKNEIKLTVNFDVQTYYPAFRKPKHKDPKNIRNKTDATWSDAFTNDPFKNEEIEIIEPKKTKWYSDIKKASGYTNNNEIDSTNGDDFDK